MLDGQYLVRQATTLLKFAKSVRDPNVSAALVEKPLISKTGQRLYRHQIRVPWRLTSRLAP